MLTKRQNSLLLKFIVNQAYKISEIPQVSDLDISTATLKRDLGALITSGYLTRQGQGRAVMYSIAPFGILHRVFSDDYLNIEESGRNSQTGYNFEAFSYIEHEALFTEDELDQLNSSTRKFHSIGKTKSDTIHKKELERFVIELSWKSSKIEGNTYTLLDTQRLLEYGTESKTNTREETIMILNHKKAFSYILDMVKVKKAITFREITNIHTLLSKELGISSGIRKTTVGITGTAYVPLSYYVQIEEQLKKLVDICSLKSNVYEQALALILGIAYIQPFEDGNKRTARLVGNAALLAGNLAPLSYRTVDEKKYREAALLFYEQNSIEAMKEIFIEQYVFAAGNYNIG
jgi:Fic family protein